jgi:hypothetical protein
MLSYRELLKPDIVLEHFSEMDSDRLADCLIDWIIDVKLLEGVIARVKNREDADYAIMVNFVIS